MRCANSSFAIVEQGGYLSFKPWYQWHHGYGKIPNHMKEALVSEQLQ
jgi:hypothetical protein